MKQTSIEWFYETIINDPLGDWEYYFKQAKEMHKQEIIEAYSEGDVNGIMNNEMRAEQYYNETYNK